MRPIVVYLACLVHVIISLKEQHLRNEYWHLQRAFNDLVSNRSIMFCGNDLSEIQCAALCLRKIGCHSFFYHKAPRQCQLHSAVLNFYTSGVTPSNGARYYLLGKVASYDCPVWAQQKNYTYDTDVNLCYALHTNETDWYEAVSRCADDGGHLLLVSNNETQTWLENWLQLRSDPFEFVFVDGNDEADEGRFIDYSNRSLLFTSWAENEPNSKVVEENCIALAQSVSYQWVDISCNRKAASVCQIDI